MGHRIEFAVADSCIGVTPKRQVKLFEEFNPRPIGRFVSTGLELAIKLARLMGGDVTVKGVQKRRSKFTPSRLTEASSGSNHYRAPMSARVENLAVTSYFLTATA